MMTNDDVLTIFQQTGALLNGHFILTSGLHSTQYFQCAKVLQHPQYAEKLCSEIADHYQNRNVQSVIAPAIGGIIVAHEVARALGVRAIFAERENGRMALRRNFAIQKDETILVVEDVITTGGSVKEVIELVHSLGANPLGVGCIVDRSGGNAQFGLDFFSVMQLQIETFQPDDPAVKNLGPAHKPGSRGLQKNG